MESFDTSKTLFINFICRQYDKATVKDLDQLLLYINYFNNYGWISYANDIWHEIKELEEERKLPPLMILPTPFLTIIKEKNKKN